MGAVGTHYGDVRTCLRTVFAWLARYNTRRRHSPNGHLSPDEYEHRHGGGRPSHNVSLWVPVMLTARTGYGMGHLMRGNLGSDSWYQARTRM
jgi:hypothetical protein